MLKPNFNPLFYGKFVFAGWGGRASSSPTGQPSAAVETQDAQTAKQTVNNRAKEVVNNRKKCIAVYGKELTDANKKTLADVIEKVTNIQTKFETGVRGKTPEKIKVILAKTLNYLKLQQQRILDIAEIITKRRELVAALKMNRKKTEERIRKMYKSEWKNNENVWEKHVELLMKAYIGRWHIANEKAITGFSKVGDIRLLHGELNGKHGSFVRGRVLDDLNTAESLIIEICRKWARGADPRSIYKDNKWDSAMSKVSFQGEVLPPLADRHATVGYVSNLIGADFAKYKAEMLKRQKNNPSNPELGPNKPKATGLKVKKVGGKVRLEIQGKNLGFLSAAKVELKEGRIDIANNMGAGVTNIILAATLIDQFNLKRAQAVRNATEYSLSQQLQNTPALYVQVAKLFTKEKNKALTKALFPGKTVIKVRGTASMEGDLSANRKLADNRAKSAEKQLRSKVKDFDKHYIVKRESLIVGPNGNDIKTDAQLKTAKKTVIKAFNKKMPNKQIRTWNELMAVLKRPSTPKQKAFIKNYFNDTRGVTLQFFKPNSSDQSFDIAPAASQARMPQV